MPEGDTIHRAANRLARVLVGKVITRVVGSVTAVTGAGLVGHRVEVVEAHGKNMAMRFDDGRVLHTHMRMNGAWHLYRAGAEAEKWWRPEHDARVAIEVEADPARGDPPMVAVCFAAPVVKLDAAKRIDARLNELGPDLIDDDFDADLAIAHLRARPARPIGEAIMDQRALAGIGNVYKSEVLFAERVDPRAPVGEISDAKLAAIVALARTLLRRNTLGSALTRVTTSGFASTRYAVYKRSHQPCPHCGAIIARIMQPPSNMNGVLNRSTYFCPRCQSSPG